MHTKPDLDSISSTAQTICASIATATDLTRKVTRPAPLRSGVRAGAGRRIDPDGEYYPTKK